MADIVSVSVGKAVGERLRPNAERMRDAQVLLRDFVDDYTANVATDDAFTAAANDDVITLEPGEGDGRNQLTKADYVNMVTRANALLAVYDAAFAMDVVLKSVIRPLRVG